MHWMHGFSCWYTSSKARLNWAWIDNRYADFWASLFIIIGEGEWDEWTKSRCRTFKRLQSTVGYKRDAFYRQMNNLYGLQTLQTYYREGTTKRIRSIIVVGLWQHSGSSYHSKMSLVADTPILVIRRQEVRLCWFGLPFSIGLNESSCCSSSDIVELDWIELLYLLCQQKVRKSKVVASGDTYILFVVERRND